jgi:hypothetical protein
MSLYKTRLSLIDSLKRKMTYQLLVLVVEEGMLGCCSRPAREVGVPRLGAGLH